MLFLSGGVANWLAEIAGRFAGDDAPVQKRHRIAAGLVFGGALVLPIALTLFLDARTSWIRRLFAIPLGGLVFLAVSMLLFCIWIRFSMWLRKWFVAAPLNAFVIAAWLALLVARFV